MKMIILISLITSFLLLGRFVDVSEEPIKSDIIVSLGGDNNGYRLQKSIELYHQGYSSSDKLIYTGPEDLNVSFSKTTSRYQFLEEQKINNIVHIDMSMITNTMEEIFFVKAYMKKNNYKTVIFISDPQHTRRISFLAKYIAGYKDDSFRVVSCNQPGWNKNFYLRTEEGRNFTFSEISKLIYNSIKYSPIFISFTDYGERDINKEILKLNKLN